MNWARNSTLVWPSPWGPAEGPKGQISLNVNNKVDFKYFTPNFVYLLTNEIYESNGIFILSPGTCPRGRTWGVTGGLRFKNILFLKFNQIWCVSYSHECDVQRHTFLVPALWDPGEGPKSQISLNFNYKVNFIFFHQTLCRCKHIRQYFHSVAWVMSQG